MSRLHKKFQELKERQKKAFVSFMSAGDPDAMVSEQLLKKLPQAGVDIIEFGMPFTDPMADGPAIQRGSERALKAGTTVAKTLGMVRRFRQEDTTTPLVLMGYYNPIFSYGCDDFVQEAVAVGVDGLIIVDLPMEEDAELRDKAQAAGLDFIRLVTPTTPAQRLEELLVDARGFVYYVSITGVTGTATAQISEVKKAIEQIKMKTELPVVAGFGIKSAEDVQNFASVADGCVVGSAIVSKIEQHIDNKDIIVEETLKFVTELSQNL